MEDGKYDHHALGFEPVLLPLVHDYVEPVAPEGKHGAAVEDMELGDHLGHSGSHHLC